jgi:hypothetical protein
MAITAVRTKDGQTYIFCVADSGGYICLQNEDGSLRQICEHGIFRGATILGDAERLPKLARKWLQQHRQLQKALG